MVGPVDLLGIYAVCIESHTQIFKLLVITKNEKSDKPGMLKSLAGCRTIHFLAGFCKIGALEHNAY